MKVRPLLPALACAALLALTACSSTASDTAATGAAADSTECPVAPVATTVSVDQWGDIVSALGGSCADVTTVLQSSSAHPRTADDRGHRHLHQRAARGGERRRL